MAAYYNEIDPFAAAWLRELVKRNLIPAGDVDERDIRDVSPDDLRRYDQCHFFAGIGGWAYALRLSGWPDNRPVWTGSCPCQPFSQAGRGGGFADERHLWPYWHYLIRECQPPVVFGEQVASKAGLAWLDLVQADLENAGYACGAVDLCAAGVGAPHIRQRLWFVAERLGNASGSGLEGRLGMSDRSDQCIAGAGSVAGGRDDSAGARHDRAQSEPEGETREPPRVCVPSTGRGAGRLGQSDGSGPQSRRETAEVARHRSPAESAGRPTGTRPTDGFWRAADWLFCRDGKWRPVEPGTFPLADGIPARVGRLRGYGNAIVPQVAAEVIRAYMEITGSLWPMP